MRFQLLAIWVLMIGLLVVPRAQAEDFFDESFGNFQEELENAKEAGKQGGFLFFEQKDCPFCDRMKTTILNRPEVVQFYKQHFVNFAIDIESQESMVDFQGHETTYKNWSEKVFRVRATPVMLFFDLNGRPVVKYTGPTRNAQEFLWLGQYVASGAYQKMPFTRYKRQQKAH
ncbi:thioredoxin family protein [Galenea microaerophila]